MEQVITKLYELKHPSQSLHRIKNGKRKSEFLPELTGTSANTLTPMEVVSSSQSLPEFVVGRFFTWALERLLVVEPQIALGVMLEVRANLSPYHANSFAELQLFLLGIFHEADLIVAHTLNNIF